MVKSNSIKSLGVSLIEVVVAIGVFMVIALPIVTLVLGGLGGVSQNEARLQALWLAEEGLEAGRAIRNAAWGNLTSGTHGLSRASGHWEFLGSSDTVGNYTRQLIVTSLDDNRKDLQAVVSLGPSQSVSLTTRFTHWQSSPSHHWVQSTLADFRAGTLEDTVVSSTGDGAVELAYDYDDNGEFISPPFDTGFSAQFQTLSWIWNGEGIIRFRTKTSNSESGLGSAVWLGPDGTRNSYYTTSGTSIATIGGTRWIQYRAYLERDNDESPRLESVTIDYAQ